MRIAVALTGAALLAGCSPSAPSGNTSAANSATPVDAATADVAEPTAPATPAAPTAPLPAASPTLIRDVGEPAAPATGASPPATSLPGGPFAPDSGQAGADVVQTYVALIEQGRIRQALRLWDNGATAPNTASFDRYGEFHANVGGPGRIEGAAGSRYVTVPVRFTGTLRSGKPFVEDGAVTLRRSAVDGASAAQKRWRIYSVDVTPGARRR